MKVKKGDQVKIVKGKDRGKKGKVIQVFPNDNLVVVDLNGKVIDGNFRRHHNTKNHN